VDPTAGGVHSGRGSLAAAQMGRSPASLPDSKGRRGTRSLPLVFRVNLKVSKWPRPGGSRTEARPRAGGRRGAPRAHSHGPSHGGTQWGRRPLPLSSRPGARLDSDRPRSRAGTSPRFKGPGRRARSLCGPHLTQPEGREAAGPVREARGSPAIGNFQGGTCSGTGKTVTTSARAFTLRGPSAGNSPRCQCSLE
jgi:hypothetical protein